MTAVQGFVGNAHGSMGPAPMVGYAVDLRTSAALTSAWVASEVVNISEARRCTLLIAYDIAASASSARPQITVWGAAEDGTSKGVAPAIASVDKWYAPAVLDAVATDAALTGTAVANFTPSVAETFRNYAVGPLSITLLPSVTASDKIRVALSLDVTHFRWLHVQAKELGDTSHLGTLGVKYVLSL